MYVACTDLLASAKPKKSRFSKKGGFAMEFHGTSHDNEIPESEFQFGAGAGGIGINRWIGIPNQVCEHGVHKELYSSTFMLTKVLMQNDFVLNPSPSHLSEMGVMYFICLGTLILS